MKISCIYKIVSKCKPDKAYIGSSVNFCYRKWNHFYFLKKNSHLNKKLQRHFNKYGGIDLSFEILERVYDKSKLIEREQYYIDLYKPHFNILKIAGSGLGQTQTEAVKKRISQANKGRKFSEEHRKKLSESHIGKTWTSEARLKLSKTNTGRIHAPEARKKMSEGAKGKIISEEQRLKISKKLTGRKIPLEIVAKVAASNTGKKHPPRSEEWKAKQREAQKRAMTPERRKQISESLTGKKQSEETILKRITKTRGAIRTPEQRLRISNSLKGKVIKEETRKKISKSVKAFFALKKSA